MRAVVTVTLLLLLSSSVSLVLGRGSDDVVAFFASKGIKQRAFAPDAHACATCTTIVNTLTDIAANATLANKTEAVLTAACDFIISLDPTLKPLEGLCSVLPDFIINLADYGINNGANGSSIVCADVLGLCVQPCCITPRAPEQVHLSFATSATTGRNASVRVSWVTLLPPANGTESKVNWRDPALVPWNTADATLSTYTLGGWQGTLHTAILEGLAPDSVYEYFVGAANDGFSAVMQFRTLPEAIGTPDRPVRWVGVTDMGFESQSNATRARIQQLVNTSAIDFVVHPGDVGYADGDQTWWDRWFREMQPVASRVPYMVGLGNHEIIWWNATAYKHRYLTPPAGLGSPSDALWYSMVSGPVTIIVLDVEAQNDTPFLGDDQLQWLQQTLEESEAAGRMTIVNLHRPLYCSSYSIQDCTTHSFYLRGRLEDTLRKYHVSAVMNGHVHNYERTWPVFNGTVVQKSYDNAGVPVYLVNGGAGNQEGQAAFYTNNNTWSAVRTVDRAFMTFQAWRDDGSSSSSFAPVYLNATLIRSSDGAILDSILVTRRFD